MNYEGEHLWPGIIGHSLIVLAFVSSLLALWAYAGATNSRKDLVASNDWMRIGRWSFGIHAVSIFGVIGLLFYIMIARYYEYEYVWGHTSDSLPFQYIFSAFWEGQEGSFLLWMFWHVVLGFVVLSRKDKWEAPVLAVFGLVQAFLSSMLLGLYFGEGDDRIGSNPFVLLRNVHEAPIFNMPNYLQSIEGTGLNPLLQNYWMTIHPPTLFLGFASTLVPFAFAIAGLWTKEHKAWIKPALTWSLFSGAILGTGILMGGAWAYEALSFGGYWAWDPVENASLVPWLIMLAGTHTALVARNSPHSIRSTYLFFILSFVLIVYSTFLTRSGVLGETSVHAFTEMGLEWQLILFMGAVSIWPLVLYVKAKKEIPNIEKEESSYSREFWMFVGALVLLFSSVLITATTSIPVWNKLADAFSALVGGGDITNIAPPEDEVAHHNRYQLWIGVLIGFLSGISVLLRYRSREISASFGRFLSVHLGIALILSISITIPLMLWSSIVAWQYWLLVGSGIFTVITNLDYIISVIRGNIKVAGAPVAHIGFGLLMVGVVFSGALKRPISEGFTSIEVNDINPQSNKNVLVVKGQPVPIADGYTVEYSRDWAEGNQQFFELKFTKKDPQGNIIEEFSTSPNVIRDSLPKNKFKFRAANPNTRHYFAKDIFTLAIPHWAFEDPEASKEEAEAAKWESHIIEPGDTFFTPGHYVVFDQIGTELPQNEAYQFQEGDIPITAILKVYELNSDSFYLAKPFLYIRDNRPLNIPFELNELGLDFRFSQILPESEDQMKMQFDVRSNKAEKAYVVVQALVFPGINWVWIGSIMMMIGLLMGMFQRMGKIKSQNLEI